MKRTPKDALIFFIMCTMLATGHCIAQGTKTTFDIVRSRSSLVWTGYYLFEFGEHTGTLDVAEGQLLIDDQQNLSGFIMADMQSVKDTDMPFDNGGKDLSEHLMSKDFFDAAQYNRAKIEIVKSEPITDSRPGAPNTKLTANLTIKQKTAPVTLYALVSRTANEIVATGKFKFDRTRWGVEYNSGKIFSEVGDGAISDAIAIAFTITATTK